MPEDSCIAAEARRALLRATRPFAVESRPRSWWCVLSTLALVGAALGIAALASWWPARLAASVVGGLLLVRAFVLYHDFVHGSILRKSLAARVLFYLYGIAVLCPPRPWRHSHNFHHAHVGRPIPVEDGAFSLLVSDVGAFPLMTTNMWRQASFWQRLRYRITRHPLTILLAYVTVFFFSICVGSLVRHPRKYWESAVSILVHGGVIALIWLWLGPLGALFGWILPFAIASAAGAYLFFAQHNFEGMRIVPSDQWTLDRAALQSSSYMKLGPVLSWFTANIGYHHVHHLNARIPSYALPKAMAAIPEAQEPMVTSLGLRDIFACLRLNLWDPERQCLVRYRDAAREHEAAVL